MKTRLVILVVVCGVTLLFFSHDTTPSERGVIMAHDFGELRDFSGTLRHTFDVPNDLEEELEVVAVRRTCSCAAVEVSQSSILPAIPRFPLTVRLEVSLGPTEFQGKVLVYTRGRTSGEKRAFAFTLRARVVASYAVTVEPATIWVGEIPGPATIRRTVVIREFSQSNAPEEAIAVESCDEGLRVLSVQQTGLTGTDPLGRRIRQLVVDLELELGEHLSRELALSVGSGSRSEQARLWFYGRPATIARAVFENTSR